MFKTHWRQKKSKNEKRLAEIRTELLDPRDIAAL